MMMMMPLLLSPRRACAVARPCVVLSLLLTAVVVILPVAAFSVLTPALFSSAPEAMLLVAPDLRRRGSRQLGDKWDLVQGWRPTLCTYYERGRETFVCLQPSLSLDGKMLLRSKTEEAVSS